MERKKILIIDDEEDILFLMKNLLEPEGYEVFLCQNARIAIEDIKTIKPDLVLIDIMMPQMTGKQVVKKIKSNPKTKKTKIIFVTVIKEHEKTNHDLQKLEFDDYISKPFENNDLILRVKRVLK